MRTTPTERTLEHLGTALALVVTAAWVVGLGAILRHRLFVTNDTMVSYAHVWFIAERLWRAHRFPIAMPVVDHGQGLAFPYGVVPWLVAALLRPVLGDRAVTLVLVAGTASLGASTLVAFPELRRGWAVAAVLLNPALVFAPLLGQTVFVAGAAMLMAAVAAWRRRWPALAAVFAGLAIATHPAIVGPIAGGLAALAFAREPDRRRLLVAVSMPALAIASPFIVMTMRAPVVADSSNATRLLGLTETLVARSGVFFVPMLLVALAPRRRWIPAAPAVLALAGVVLWTPLGLPWAAAGLNRRPLTGMAEFVRGSAFRRGDTYRVLRLADGKVGAYELLLAGARLDADFFPEDIQRRSWPSAAAYVRFLDARRVDEVMLWRGYDHRYRTNEHVLLRQLAGGATCAPGQARAALVTSVRDYDLFEVRRTCAPVTSTA